MSTPIPDWPRVHSEPLFAAQLRTVPDDFQVTENLGWEPSGDGEHDFLLVEKTGANTEWVARKIAQHAGVAHGEVGYAGLKDRHAVNTQWYSVPRWHAPDWASLCVEGVRVLQVTRHLRKLRRGAHRSNRFRIILRYTTPPDLESVRTRLQQIGEHGVPNYFGEQRFGRNGANLQLADNWARGRRLPRHKRSLAISAVRAFAFNELLATRVQDASWDRLLAGDKANLDGSASVFEIPEIDEELRRRCATMDIHPAVALASDGGDMAPAHWQEALNKARVQPDTRSLRLPVRDLAMEANNNQLCLSFTLGRGSFATAVLREICHWNSEAGGPAQPPPTA